MDKKVKKHSLMFVPSSGQIKQLQVSPKMLRNLVIVLILVLVVNIGFFAFNIFSIPRFKKIQEVHYTNSKLRKDIAFIQAKLDTSKNQLEQLSSFEKTLRTIQGLDQISNPEGVIGIGGPSLYNKPDLTNKSVLEKKGAKLLYALDSLNSQLSLQMESYSELCSTYEAKQAILDRTPSIKPMKGYITSVFGSRIDPFTNLARRHEGIDIVAPKGSSVMATADGVVTFAGWYHDYGKMVKINHKYYTTRYGHLDQISVKPGQRIKRGQVLGTCGKTGRATGVHLHYEVRIAGKPVDPQKYILPSRYVVD